MSSPHFCVFDNSDDHQAEQFFLSSSHFKGNSSREQVYSAVSGLIQLINGASAIQWGFNDYISRGGISLDRLYSTTEEQPRESDWSPVNMSGTIPPSNPFIGDAYKSKLINPYRNITTAYIELCLEHEDVFTLLRQISVGFDWRNLYCIWDTICHYCRGSKNAISDLKLDAKRIKAFTGTANNFGVLGLEARHGVMGWKIPKNTVDKNEAIEIINEVVNKYLEHKVCLGCKRKEWDEQFNKPT